MNDKKERSFTLRVSDKLFETFERTREYYEQKGERKTMSQIVREQLEAQQSIEALQPRQQLFALQENKAHTLQHLHKKMVHDEGLTRVEWEFLCVMAHDAYSTSGRTAQDSTLLSDALRAFGAFMQFCDKYLKRASPDGANYYRSNLLTPKDPGEEVTLYDALEYTLTVINSAPVTQVGAHFMMRNVEICLRDAPERLPEGGIDACFKPYGKSLLTLAAFAYYQDSVRETGRQQPYMPLSFDAWPSTIWSELFGEGSIKLRVQRTDDSVTALLDLSIEWFTDFASFNYRHLEDFIVAVTYSCAAGGYEVIDSTPQGGKYCFLGFPSGTRWCMDKTHFDELKAVVAECVSHEEVGRIRAAARLVYGTV